MPACKNLTYANRQRSDRTFTHMFNMFRWTNLPAFVRLNVNQGARP